MLLYLNGLFWLTSFCIQVLLLSLKTTLCLNYNAKLILCESLKVNQNNHDPSLTVSSLSLFLVQTQIQEIRLCYLYLQQLNCYPVLTFKAHVICIEINETYVASLSPWQRLRSIHGTVWAHLSFPFSMRNHAVAIYNHGNSRTNGSGFKGIRGTANIEVL